LILVIGIYKALPTIVHQITQLTNLTKSVYDEQQDHELFQYVVSLLGDVNIEGYVKQSLDFVLKISNWGLNMLLALILSLFFLLEKTKVTQFTAKFKTSKLAWFFDEIEFFGKKFVHTFGKVIEAQFLIALTNCILSTIMLWIMGFPQLFGLALMIFVLGLIPVAGVIISLIPLCAIAFSIGGFMKVIYVLVMVIVLHSLEAYLLNPKLMASKTNLPMFYTFIVLIFSEHFFGVWGLIVGIPTFVFLLDILDVKRT
jgi:predicted PurR-regulated permease PerM